MDLSGKHVMCVCTGNICRSPMAARLLRHALDAEPEPLASLPVVSAGTAAGFGDPPSINSERALQAVNLNLAGFSSQMVTEALVRDAVLVLCMTESHCLLLEEAFPELETPIVLFRGFLPPEKGHQIPDPFGSSLPTYEAARDSMVEAIPSIVEWLREFARTGEQDR